MVGESGGLHGRFQRRLRDRGRPPSGNALNYAQAERVVSAMQTRASAPRRPRPQSLGEWEARRKQSPTTKMDMAEPRRNQPMRHSETRAFGEDVLEDFTEWEEDYESVWTAGP